MLGDKNSVLAQKPLVLTKKRLRWLILLSSFPLFGMVAAFGIAPDTSLEEPPVEEVILGLELPEIRSSFRRQYDILASGKHSAWRYNCDPAFPARRE